MFGRAVLSSCFALDQLPQAAARHDDVSMPRFLAAASGLLAVVLYGVAVVLGGYRWTAYSHLAQPVSDLIATGAPTKPLLDPMFAVYNLLTGWFGWGLLRASREGRVRAASAAAGAAGAALLMLESLAGLLTLLFPEGEGGASSAIGPGGTAHIVFAGISSLASLLAIVFAGRWLAQARASRGVWRFSVMAAVAVAATGALTAFAVANHTPWAGLSERLTIGAFLLWQAVVALLSWPLLAAPRNGRA